MDVGAPSNFERIQWLYANDYEAIRRDMAGAVFDDETVRQAIADVYRQHGYLMDPHGAIGWLALNEVMTTMPDDVQGVFLATAHPAKFREVVEPVIGRPVELPAVLQEAIARPRYAVRIPADYRALNELLRQ